MLLLPLVLASAVVGGTGFADALMREGDYFRAITEYKRGLFTASDPGVRQWCRLRIARAYRKSAHFASAVPYVASVVEDPAAGDAMRRSAQIELGLDYLQWGQASLGAPYFRAAGIGDSTAFPRLGLALVELEEGRPSRAAEEFHRIALTRGDSASRADLLDLASETEGFARARRVSPALATTLSLVVPGSGQVYSGHVYDGLQAFMFVGTFTLATIATYQYERSVHDRLGWTFVGVSVTSLFHAANLFGANRTAHYRNWKLRLDFNRAARERVLRYEPEAEIP